MSQPNLTVIAQSVFSSLQDDLNELNELINQLKLEREVLEKNQHDKLAPINQRKEELSISLDARNKKRVKLLKRHNISADSNSWKPTIEAMQNQSRLPVLALWEQIEERLKDCQKENLINEKIVVNHQNSVNQLINALRGSSASGNTYGKSGKAEVFSQNQTITSV